MHSALEVSKYIVNKCTVENFPISNLQLQKILYYVQKEFFKKNLRCFSEEIEAWQIGPVVTDVYYYFCGYGAMPILMEYEIKIEKNYSEIIDKIVGKNRGLMPWQLLEDVHKIGKP